MFAAVEIAREVVWGVGNTPQEAMKEAHEQNAMKIPSVRFKRKLDIVPIRPFPELIDGAGMFEYCVFENESVQFNLFD